jgi:hypothetical protein
MIRGNLFQNIPQSVMCLLRKFAQIQAIFLFLNGDVLCLHLNGATHPNELHQQDTENGNHPKYNNGINGPAIHLNKVTFFKGILKVN